MMDAAILFYLARKTSACQRNIEHIAGYFSLPVAETAVCVREPGLRPQTARLVRGHAAVFVVSACRGARPACAPALFGLLRVPLDSRGEPKGVLRLEGGQMRGYLIESQNRAIAVLPDEPEELERMLPRAMERLKRKFGLAGELPAPETKDYEALVEASMERIPGKE